MKEIDLPDFESMYKIVEEIRDKTLAHGILKAEIEEAESVITRTATENEEYFVGGKPPSQAHIQRAYFPTGFDGELLEKRKALAKLDTDVEYLKMRLDLDKLVIDVWRTESANKRLAVS